MAAGDHLVTLYGSFTHHGIDIGDGTVVHLSKAESQILRVPFVEFCDGREAWIREYAAAESASTVVARALSLVGKPGYWLISKNCEHIATWCKTGKWESSQVRFVQRQLVAAVAKGSSKAVVKALAKGSSKLGVKTIARAATPVLFVADVLQLATEVAAGNLGAQPKKAELVGRSVGLVASVGIGAAVAGPIGAGVGFGLWAFGEVMGAVFSG